MGHTGNNILTVLMYAHGFTLQEASTHVGEVYAEFMRIYLDAKARLSSYSFGDAQLDADVARYVEAMDNWPIANIVSMRLERLFEPLCTGDTDGGTIDLELRDGAVLLSARRSQADGTCRPQEASS